MYEIQLFGRLEVRTRGVRLTGDELGDERARRILALLALHGSLGATKLASLLWEGDPPADHLTTVEDELVRLGLRLDPSASEGHSAITASEDGYALTADQVRVDVARFDELVAAASGRSSSGALRPLTAAAHLADRPLLEDLDSASPWADAAREHYRVRLVDALLDAAGHALTAEEPASAVRLAERALELDPSTERAWAILAEATANSTV